MERGAGLCTAPSTYRLGVQGHAGRARPRVKPEAARGAQPQASTERVRISGRSPALDRRSPAGGHHDDESRRRERCSAAPRVADSAHQRRHTTDSDPRSRLSRAKVARPGRQAQPVRACPCPAPQGDAKPARRGFAQRSPRRQAQRAAPQARRRQGLKPARGETRPARRSTARCAARKPGPAGETPRDLAFRGWPIGSARQQVSSIKPELRPLVEQLSLRRITRFRSRIPICQPTASAHLSI